MTAVEFNSTGEFLAIGDRAGRISVVQELNGEAASRKQGTAENPTPRRSSFSPSTLLATLADLCLATLCVFSSSLRV